MAVTMYTLDRAERTLFYRKNKEGVPVQLPFDLVKIDGTDYYEPHALTRLAENGKRQAGSVVGAVFLSRNQRLPRPAANQDPDKYGVWLYYGI